MVIGLHNAVLFLKVPATLFYFKFRSKTLSI